MSLRAFNIFDDILLLSRFPEVWFFPAVFVQEAFSSTEVLTDSEKKSQDSKREMLKKKKVIMDQLHLSTNIYSICFLLTLLPEGSLHGMKQGLEEMRKSKRKYCYDGASECLQSIFWYSSHMQIMKSLMSDHEAWGNTHNGLIRTASLYLCEINWRTVDKVVSETVYIKHHLSGNFSWKHNL